ncbi:uncharacterized protein LOC144773614 [Lissotriton helveticus]
MEYEEYYEEEESEQVMYLPVDDHFCQVMDSSIMKAVSRVVAPLEKKISQLQAQCQPLGQREDPSGQTDPLPPGQPSTSVDPKRKRSSDTGVDSDAFSRLKTAFLDAKTVETPSTSKEAPTGASGGQDDASVDRDESPQTSDGDGDPETSWLPSQPAQPFPSDPSTDMLNPEELLHPRSSQWVPAPKVAAYMAARLRKPLDQEVRSCLWAECPRPTLEGKVTVTPEIDAKMSTFLTKFVKDPKKGIDRSWKACQDKLLDAAGTLAKMLDMAEDAKASGSLISPETLSGWAQRAIIFLGNANVAISTERRRSILIKIDPKLGELATSEAGPLADGNLFGDPFVKELGKFVNTFNSLDKAQTSVKRIFTPRVFGAAGRGRGRSTGRPYNRGSYKQGDSHRGQYQDPDKFGNFYQTRGPRRRGGRGRGDGGYNAQRGSDAGK